MLWLNIHNTTYCCNNFIQSQFRDIKNIHSARWWWLCHTPLTPALGKQADLCEFEASLVYRSSSRATRATQRNPVTKNKRTPFYLLRQSLSLHSELTNSCYFNYQLSLETTPRPCFLDAGVTRGHPSRLGLYVDTGHPPQVFRLS
jgi:hypothetical protein